jgi:hypothetical protein
LQILVNSMNRIYCGSAQPPTDDTNIAIPTVPKPTVTELSCHGVALWHSRRLPPKML